MWAIFGKVAAGAAAFILLFGRGGKDEGQIFVEGMGDVEVVDNTGSTVLSTVSWRRGLVQFINDAPNKHYARVEIDGMIVGEDRGHSPYMAPGERRLHDIKKLGDDAGDLGCHKVIAYIYVRDGKKLRKIDELSYDLYISTTQRRTSVGSGVYWVIEVRTGYIGEGYM